MQEYAHHVLFIAQCHILPHSKHSVNSCSNQTQEHPHSHILTAIYNAILTNLVYPVEVVSKCIAFH